MLLEYEHALCATMVFGVVSVHVLTNRIVPRSLEKANMSNIFLTREEKMKFKGKPVNISELWYE